jgi:hypothetical protein
MEAAVARVRGHPEAAEVILRLIVVSQVVRAVAHKEMVLLVQEHLDKEIMAALALMVIASLPTVVVAAALVA